MLVECSINLIEHEIHDTALYPFIHKQRFPGSSWARDASAYSKRRVATLTYQNGTGMASGFHFVKVNACIKPLFWAHLNLSMGTTGRGV
jgi:hypothetical protein